MEDNKLTLVCAPGTLCNGRAFEPLGRALAARGFEVELLIADTAKFQTVGEVVKDTVGRIGSAASGRLVVAGFSLGGVIAVHITLALAHRVCGLILLDMNGEADVPGNAVNRRAAVARAREKGVANFIANETWPTHVAKSHLDDDPLRREIIRMAEETGIEGFANQAEIAISRPRAIDSLPQITVPVQVICGAEDRITPPQLTRDIAQALSQAQYTLIEDAGHFAILEQPEVIADIVSPWIASLKSKAAA